jgi:multisubunit Na+/H+ antiporter MnhB subunit
LRDLREYTKQTNVRLALGAFILLFVVGVALIWVFYGERAAGMGFVCLLAALFPVILILGIFLGIEWILKRARPK